MPLECTTQMTGSKTKSVRFDERCRVRPIVHVNNLSEPTIRVLWYSRFEMKSMKEDCRCTIKLAAQRRSSFSQNKSAFRGLEMFHPKISRRREGSRIDVWDAVLREQSEQLFQGVKDNERMAELCPKINSKTTQEARERATRDTDDLLQSEKTWEMPAVGPPLENLITGSTMQLPKASSLPPLMKNTIVF
jgi:hypothetical protein